MNVVWISAAVEATFNSLLIAEKIRRVLVPSHSAHHFPSAIALALHVLIAIPMFFE